MRLPRTPPRLGGKVKVGCPVCGKLYGPIDVSLPVNNVGMHDLVLKRVISIPTPQQPEQAQLFGELEMNCTACRVPFAQYVPITEPSA